MKTLKACCCLLIAACSFPFFAKPIEFQVRGLQTRRPYPILTTIDWDEKQFGKTPTTTYNHSIARIACLLSEDAYVKVSPETAEDALSQCYVLLGVSHEDIEYHYDVDYSDPIWGNDQCAFTLAKKEIDSAKGKRTLVFVTVRGTPLGAEEWVSNIDVGNGSESAEIMHQGFLKTSLRIEKTLLSYLLRHNIRPEHTFFLITGHSRGAAVANMLAANLLLDAQFNPDNLYVYTFATPNVTTDTAAHDAKYNYIWNIVNAEDVVPTVPLLRDKWRYRKYGHTLTLVDAWNVDPDTYKNYYYPKMNEYFNTFVKRKYRPFHLGPFVPVQITRLLVGLNEDVHHFYGGAFGLHNKIEFALTKFLPSQKKEAEKKKAEAEQPAPEPKKEETPEKKSEPLSERIYNWVNGTLDGFIDYVADAAVDMHADETYLAWMLAFDENELFSDLGNTQLLIRGTFECAVFDADGTLLARIKDSRIIYRSIKLPVASMQIRGNLLTIGFPANADFTVALYRGSIIPCPVTLQIEHYSSCGELLDTTEKQKISLRRGIAYKIKAGTILLTADAAEIERISGEEKQAVVKAGQMHHLWDFTVVPEVHFDTNLHFGGGIHVGTQAVYGSTLLSSNAYGMTKSLVIAEGIGTQQNIFGPIMLDIEGYSKFVCSFSDNNHWDIVPSLRTTLSFKPRHRVQFFAGPVFDFHIADFNDTAFSKDVTKRNMGTITLSDSVSAVPSIQFGIRF